MTKLFGTDGVRGIANQELSPLLAFEIGRAATHVLSKRNKGKVKIVIGMDTRISGDMLESALTAGITSLGADVYTAGIVPTPSIALITRTMGFTAGIVISASHNPFMDNGIKLFSSEGYKLSDELEKEIENIVFNSDYKIEIPKSENVGRRISYSEMIEKYEGLLLDSVNSQSFKNIKVVVDCANGSTFKVAPKILEKLDCDYIAINNKPNGININLEAGSTHMEGLAKAVVDSKADIGIAYDGDGDRCLLVDGNGNYVDGDQIMSICAKQLLDNGQLKNKGFVATVMSNLGLFLMGDENDITIKEANVGDRYVLEKMIEDDYNFGGEQSGHIIFLDYNTTGDGILTSLQVLKLMKETGKSLEELNSVIRLMPQILLNIKVDNGLKYRYLENANIRKALAETEKKFENDGRVLVRPSGTEPLIRIMIESFDQELIEKEAKLLGEIIKKELNS